MEKIFTERPSKLLSTSLSSTQSYAFRIQLFFMEVHLKMLFYRPKCLVDFFMLSIGNYIILFLNEKWLTLIKLEFWLNCETPNSIKLLGPHCHLENPCKT